MAGFELAARLKRDGRFAEALAALPTSNISAQSEVLRAELLERLGRYGESRSIAERLLKGHRIEHRDRSTCHIVVGRANWNEGRVDAALEHFQRAVTVAQDSSDQ